MLDEAQVETLATLLREVARSGQGVPNLPAPVFAALKDVVAQPTAELLLEREGRVLLTPREDEHWRAWHLPGGFVGCGEGLDDACRRLALRELGIDVRLEGIVGHGCWPDHPYASPLLLLCRCAFDAAPAAGEFFAEPPEALIPRHRELLRAYGWPR